MTARKAIRCCYLDAERPFTTERDLALALLHLKIGQASPVEQDLLGGYIRWVEALIEASADVTPSRERVGTL